MNSLEGMRMEWIKCSDRLPEDRIDVLVYNGEACSVSSYLKEFYNKFGYHEWSHNEEQFNYNEVTHWMPLPQPPKE